MGSNVSTQITEQSQDIIKNTLNEVNNTSSQEMSCDVTNTQNITIGNGGGDMNIGSDCEITIGQQINVNLSCLLESAQSSTNEQTAQTLTQIQALAASSIDQHNEELNLLQTNVSTAIQETNQYLENNVQNIINNNINSTLSSNASNSAEIFLNFNNLNCEGGELNLSQEGIIDSIAKLSAEQIQEAVTEIISEDTATQENTQETSQTNKGVNPMALFGGIVLIIAVILGFAAYLLLS